MAAPVVQPQIEGVPEGLVGTPVEQIEGVPQGLTGEPIGAAKTPAPAAPVAEERPGYVKRLAQSVGAPTTAQEAGLGDEALEAHQATPAWKTAVEAQPEYQAGRMIYGAGKQAVKGIKEGAHEVTEAEENIAAGQPILRNVGKGAYGIMHGLLQSVPFIGAPTETAGEDIQNKNYAGAAGGLTGVIGQVVAPELAERGMARWGAKTEPRLGGTYYTEPSVGAPDTTAGPRKMGRVPYAGPEHILEPEVPEQAITPEITAQVAAEQGIRPVTRHAPIPENSRINRLDVVENAEPKPIVPSQGQTLEMPGGTVRPAKPLALPAAPPTEVAAPTPEPIPEVKVEEPGDLKTLKAVGGKVVDTDPQGLNKQLESALTENTAPKIEGAPEGLKPIPIAKAEPAEAEPLVKTEEPGKIIDKAKAQAHADEGLENATKDRAAEMEAKYAGRKPVGLYKDPFAPPAEKAVPETAGTAEGTKADNDHFQAAKKELGEKASISDVAKRAQEMKDEAAAPKAEPLDHAAIAKAHNDNQGFTYNSKEGFVG